MSLYDLWFQGESLWLQGDNSRLNLLFDTRVCLYSDDSLVILFNSKVSLP
jgi:hypothetical protein